MPISIVTTVINCVIIVCSHKIGSPKLKSTTGCQSLITAKTITSETKGNVIIIYNRLV